MGFEINNAALKALYEEIGKKIAEADSAFRDSFGGKPVSEVEPHVAGAFEQIGVELQQGQIRDYAAAVSAGAPFEWELV